ncbi:MAG TPA: PIN domain-containing protein [Nitrospirae bacterium]|nr:PIN domain-containing protein [Nitrospirota bacterium]
MKKTGKPVSYVFDTSAILALWNNEEGADTVEHILRSEATIHISFMSFMEGRYRLWKNAGKDESDEFSRHLDLLPVKRVGITDLIFEKSVEIKATKNLSVCDSWIIATAMATESVLVHKDPEFEQVKRKVKLKTLPYKKKAKNP